MEYSATRISANNGRILTSFVAKLQRIELQPFFHNLSNPHFLIVREIFAINDTSVLIASLTLVMLLSDMQKEANTWDDAIHQLGIFSTCFQILTGAETLEIPIPPPSSSYCFCLEVSFPQSRGRWAGRCWERAGLSPHSGRTPSFFQLFFHLGVGLLQNTSSFPILSPPASSVAHCRPPPAARKQGVGATRRHCPPRHQAGVEWRAIFSAQARTSGKRGR